MAVHIMQLADTDRSDIPSAWLNFGHLKNDCTALGMSEILSH